MKSRTRPLIALALAATTAFAGAQERSPVSDAPERANRSQAATRAPQESNASSGGGDYASRSYSEASNSRVSPRGIQPRPNDPPRPRPNPFRPLYPEIWTAKSQYAVGETVEFYFSVSEDAYVYIFNTDARGHESQIFPNYWDRANYVRGGRTYRIPTYRPDDYRFTVTPPAGVESITILAVSERYPEVECYHDNYSAVDPFPSSIPSPYQVMDSMANAWFGFSVDGPHGTMTFQGSGSGGFSATATFGRDGGRNDDRGRGGYDDRDDNRGRGRGGSNDRGGNRGDDRGGYDDSQRTGYEGDGRGGYAGTNQGGASGRIAVQPNYPPQPSEYRYGAATMTISTYQPRQSYEPPRPTYVPRPHIPTPPSPPRPSLPDPPSFPKPPRPPWPFR